MDLARCPFACLFFLFFEFWYSGFRGPDGFDGLEGHLWSWLGPQFDSARFHWGMMLGMDLERSSLDEKLLSLARRSPQEIAEVTGLEPQYVAERISFLLDSKDWLSDRQEERLLLIEAASLKDRAFEMLEATGPQEFAGVANVVLKSLRLVSDRLDARRKLVDDDIGKITRAHAKMFAEAFDTALRFIVEGFKAFDGVPSDDEVDQLVEQGLRKAENVLNEYIFE